MDILKNIYKKEIKKLLSYGRLPTHEAIKVEIAKLAKENGYTAQVEFRQPFSIDGRYRKGGRIDVVWKDSLGVIVSAFEIDEGIDRRSVAKLLACPATNKFLVMFDVKKMMRRRINKFPFVRLGITPIDLL